MTGEGLLKTYGERHVIFVTLTFPTPMNSVREARKFLNSMLNAIRARYEANLWVMETNKSNAIHYHLLLPVKADVYDGTYVCGFERHLYAPESTLRKYMNQALREEADWIGERAKTHGFGRTQVAPIYSENPSAVVNYLCKQDWRRGPWPFVESKGIQFWNSSKNIRIGNTKFSWLGARSKEERMSLKQWTIGVLSVDPENTERIRELEETGFAELKAHLGSRWHYQYQLYRLYQKDTETLIAECQIAKSLEKKT